MPKLKFAIPKGSLQESTMTLLKEAGYKIYNGKRSYRPSCNDTELEIKILRPQEIPTMVSQQAHDLAITGRDWIFETSANVKIILDLEYGRINLVLAVPDQWADVNSCTDLLKKFINKNQDVRIFTEYLSSCKKYILNNEYYKDKFGDIEPSIITPWWKIGENDKIKLIMSFGATEAKPPEDAEAIFDNTETGTTIAANELKIIDRVSESTAVLIANIDSWNDEWKREKIKDVALLLKGVVEARKKLHIFLNIENKNIEKLLDKLPALKRPTISPLTGVEGWSALNTIIQKDKFIELLPILRKYAEGIVIHEPRQILPSFSELKDNWD
ncbi:MAG: ATP phosphoribosyltransferase [Promethearchaeota archaeon]|nr:MAG: ATP phosphoribosyltransferase [Candidatus Lokiarchaeota archaeon]